MVDRITEGNLITATSPLTLEIFASEIFKLCENEVFLAFFDAISPIIYKDSIKFDIAWFQSRYDKGDGKYYINCPLISNEYYKFVENLVISERTEFKE